MQQLQWFYQHLAMGRQEIVGPVNHNQLVQLMADGVLMPSDFVSSPTVTQGNWVPAVQVPGLRRIFEQLRQQVGPPPRVSDGPTSVILTKSGSTVSPVGVRLALQNGDVKADEIKRSYLVGWSVQNVRGRQGVVKAIGALEAALGFRPKVLAAERFDLLWNINSSTLGLDRWDQPFDGPYWDFMQAGLGDTPIATPPFSATNPGASAPQAIGLKEQYVRSSLSRAGWKFSNATAAPFFGLPYSPRINTTTKTIWYNQQKMDVRNSIWQDLAVNFLRTQVNDLNLQGVLFQFAKPQHYGNKNNTLPPNNSNPYLYRWVENPVDRNGLPTRAHWDSVNSPSAIGNQRFVRFDAPIETPYEWFKAYEQIFYKVKSQCGGILVLDTTFFGIAVWRYARQIIDEWAKVNSMTIAAAAAGFYQAIFAMAQQSDLVIFDETLPVANKSAAYQLPSPFITSMNALPRLATTDIRKRVSNGWERRMNDARRNRPGSR